MTHLWLVMLALAGTFEDTQKRFTLELPVGWQFTPLPGDLKGATFKKTFDDVPASCGVRFFPVEPDARLDALARQLALGVSREPGYRLLSEELDTLAGQPAIRRRYVVSINGDTKWLKMAEDRVAVVGDQGILLHVETLAEAFGAFEEDFRGMAASLVLRGVKGTPALPAASAVGGKSSAAELLGRWVLVGNSAVVLALRRDGTFDLAGVRGVFRVDGAVLHLAPTEGPGDTYRWTVDGPELVLSAPSLAEPARYQRAPAAQP